MTEAAQVYDEVLANGGDDMTAKESSTKAFLANAVLLAVTERVGVLSPDVAGWIKRSILSMPVEGVQEAAQTLIQNVSTGKPTWEGVLESGAIGAVIAPVLAGGVELAGLGGKGAVSTVVPDATPTATAAPAPQTANIPDEVATVPAAELQRRLEGAPLPSPTAPVAQNKARGGVPVGEGSGATTTETKPATP